MWQHNINPIFVSLGPIDIRYYGLVYFLGFIFTYYFLKRIASKGLIKNFNKENLDSFMIYEILGSIIGARILDFVFFYPQIIIQNPSQLLYIWNGGMSIHGGIIGALVAGYFFTKKYKVSFLKLADQAMLPLTIMLGIGRIANYINGELWGKITTSNFCINYEQSQYVINPPEGCRYPYQIYASAKNFAVAIITYLMLKNHKLKDGTVFFSSIALYSIGRFLVDFTRDVTTNGNWLNTIIPSGQILSLIFFLIAIYFLIKNKAWKIS
ncbi:prolipoprotein diacylglyceryl transferase [Candidatus Woesearchaeota archaeon]|nr:prolipoprotein diacylglyceryl transferase [Candidatus Woesearchaeota archaeon]MCF7901463.1 prolipoprotein diacylglyceryl transferase [Candidatus Woesearchaeota archaeon]MCF8013548.1 prolipoprotein diacylglyceryl transferase [Candidatus Woesearchaeota archaeon]